MRMEENTHGAMNFLCRIAILRRVILMLLPHVGNYISGVSPYGCFDMAGNMYEWVPIGINDMKEINLFVKNRTDYRVFERRLIYDR